MSGNTEIAIIKAVIASLKEDIRGLDTQLIIQERQFIEIKLENTKIHTLELKIQELQAGNNQLKDEIKKLEEEGESNQGDIEDYYFFLISFDACCAAEAIHIHWDHLPEECIQKLIRDGHQKENYN